MKDSIKIDSVFLDFNDVKILRGVSLEFKPNKVTGLLGRNGCGKSCLLKIITGQISPQSKYISYNGNKLENLYKRKSLINYLPQHEFHPKHINLVELLKIYEIDNNSFFNKYPFLDNSKTENFSNLSGGARRIIEVLLVLESDSKFSILDEPFSHIMPVYIDLVKSRIIELSAKKGILITDHQYANVLEVADQIFLMKDGTLKSIESIKDLQFHGYIR